MKYKLLFLMICFYPLVSYAQNECLATARSLYPEDRRWLLSVSVGTNVDLSGSSSNPNSELLGSRRDVAFMQKYRLTHLFSGKVGWYADMQFNIYWDKWSHYYDELLSDNVFMALFESIGEGLAGGLFFIHPSVSAGLVYRIEHGRWKIHPEAGFGYGMYLYGRDKSKDTTKDDVEHSLIYRQRARSLYVDFGVSANYFITRRCFLVANAGFRQPLQKSHAELIRTENGIEVDKRYYETSRIGRSLNASFGLGFTLGENHR